MLMMRPTWLSSTALRTVLATSLAAYAAVTVLSVTGYTQGTKPIADGAFTADQATRGNKVYLDKCASCHGRNLEGSEGPALSGADFMQDFAGKSVADLVQKIVATMPDDNPGSVSRDEATLMAAYILQTGVKAPAGRAALSDATAAQFVFPGQQKSQQASGATLNFVPANNLAQFMRGITFPNANIVFNTQVKDPGAYKPKPVVPFDYEAWGRTQYYGWDAVDQAVFALKETTPLFLLPGRKCQNGRPVPVDKADYQKFTHDLENFMDELYKVVLTRDAEKVAAMSERLNETCAACHRVYRDIQPAGAPQSSSAEGGIKADRCKVN